MTKLSRLHHMRNIDIYNIRLRSQDLQYNLPQGTRMAGTRSVYLCHRLRELRRVVEEAAVLLELFDSAGC